MFEPVGEAEGTKNKSAAGYMRQNLFFCFCLQRAGIPIASGRALSVRQSIAQPHNC